MTTITKTNQVGIPDEKALQNAKVTEIITWACQKFPRQMSQLSEKLGYAFNAVYLMKTGQFKVPLDRIFDVANVLEIDPIFFRNKVFSEYVPVYWKAEQEYIDTHRKYPFEQEVLKIIRDEGVKFAKLSEEDKNELRALLDKIKARRIEELRSQERTAI